MEKRMNKLQLDRIRYIEAQVKEGMTRGKLVSARNLARGYEKSEKTIKRDIEFMRCYLDAPIEYDQKRHGWYYTEPDFTLQHIKLSESDLFAVCVAEKALEQYRGTPVYDRLAKVFEKINASLPPKTVAVLPEFTSHITMLSFPLSAADGEIWQVVTDGLKEGRTVRISYRKPGDKLAASRRIDPYHLVDHHGTWYVIAYCHKRDGLRNFNMGRIREAGLTDRQFTVPEGFDAEKMVLESFDMYIGKEAKTVRILFSPKIAPYIEEKSWHPSQKLKPMPDGSLIFTAAVNNLIGIIPWIFSWGPNATILEPPELVEEFRRDLDGLVANYRDQ